MFHPDTQALIDQWTALSRRAGVRAGVPERSDFAPDALGLRLPRAFMAKRTGDDAVLRLAGSWIEAFHGGPLADRSLLSLWRSASRALVATAAIQTVREARPVVISALAGALSAPIEIAMVPFRSGSGQADRILGLYAPTATLTFASEEPRLLTARVSISVGDVGRAALSLATVGGRRVA